MGVKKYQGQIFVLEKELGHKMNVTEKDETCEERRRRGEESLTARVSRGVYQSWNTRAGERGKEGKFNGRGMT